MFLKTRLVGATAGLAIAFAGCINEPADRQAQPSKPISNLAEAKHLLGHWVCVNGPTTHGLMLKPNGRGHSAGIDRGNNPPLKWRVLEPGILEVTGVGEEGEHGPYEKIPYKIKGNRLILERPFDECTELRRIIPEEGPLPNAP
jgi:hypothetical protein